ncbi:50S ribosomal protein L13 [Candidatus Saccharibacteria bacterium]|nr:MAG: 50S ribosomal protein L13 [Candidatus Saccharibacteria bacterium]
MSKTFSLKAADVSHKWIVVDASTAPLGRLASFVATRLTGKYQPTFTPHMDSGDYVVVINAGKLVVTGNKDEDKKYYRHSGFPGGIKERTLKEVKGLDSTAAITAAVKGMLPKNKLAPERLARLRVFAGETHTHEPQKPAKLEVK